MTQSSTRVIPWDRLRDRAAELNKQPIEKWMEQPLALRVALEVLDPEMSSKPRSSLEIELALYVLYLSGVTDG